MHGRKITEVYTEIRYKLYYGDDGTSLKWEESLPRRMTIQRWLLVNVGTDQFIHSLNKVIGPDWTMTCLDGIFSPENSNRCGDLLSIGFKDKKKAAWFKLHFGESNLKRESK